MDPEASLFSGRDKNSEIWLKLTALVIHAAVSGINKYNGKYYFSVNIPPQLASGNALPGMAKRPSKCYSNRSGPGN